MKIRSTIRNCLLATGLILSATSNVFAENWQPVTGEADLRAVFNGTIMRAIAEDGTVSIALYYADGTGELQANGEILDRNWGIKGNDQACIIEDEIARCFTLEVDSDDPLSHRASDVRTGGSRIFTIEGQITARNNTD